jgi:hypothetical protein
MVRAELATGPRPRSWTCWHWSGGWVKNDREWSKMGVVSEPAQQVQYVVLSWTYCTTDQLFVLWPALYSYYRPALYSHSTIMDVASATTPHCICMQRQHTRHVRSIAHGARTHLHAQPTPRQALFLFGSFVRKLGSELRVLCGLLQLYYVRTCIYEYPIHRPTRTTS